MNSVASRCLVQWVSMRCFCGGWIGVLQLHEYVVDKTNGVIEELESISVDH